MFDFSLFFYSKKESYCKKTIFHGQLQKSFKITILKKQSLSRAKSPENYPVCFGFLPCLFL